MKKLSESIWSEIEDRSSGDVVRKEDGLLNIRELKPVDMGGSVLWADRDLSYGDEYHFGFSDVFELVKNSGWRLPTLEEVTELDNYKVKTIDNDGPELYYEYIIQGPSKLEFRSRGLYYSDKTNSITDDDFYYAWTSDLYNNHQVHIITFDDDKIIHTKPGSRHIIDQCTNDISGKLCVRLIKNK